MKLWHVILGISIAGVVAASLSGQQSTVTHSSSSLLVTNAATSSVQKTNDTQADDMDQKLAALRMVRAGAAALAVKQNLRNPDSLQWDYVSTNKDGSLVCIVYRAQNGFGGMNLEPAVSLYGHITFEGNAWNKNCKGQHHYPLTQRINIAMDLAMNANSSQ